MATPAEVSVLRTEPWSVIEDCCRQLKLAEADKLLNSGTTDIFNDETLWHHPMPSANIAPLQFEGTVLGLEGLGYADISCVRNKPAEHRPPADREVPHLHHDHRRDAERVRLPELDLKPPQTA